MAKGWTLAKRRAAAKKAWATRRRKRAWRGICPYCREKVWVRGIEREGRIWHDLCYERHKFKIPKPGAT